MSLEYLMPACQKYQALDTLLISGNLSAAWCVFIQLQTLVLSYTNEPWEKCRASLNVKKWRGNFLNLYIKKIKYSAVLFITLPMIHTLPLRGYRTWGKRCHFFCWRGRKHRGSFDNSVTLTLFSSNYNNSNTKSLSLLCSLSNIYNLTEYFK